MTHLGDLLVQTARLHPSAHALSYRGRRYTFAEIFQQVEWMSIKLRQRGIQAKDRIVLLAPNCPAFSILYFACLRVDAVVVPLNPLLAAEEINTILGDCQPAMICIERSLQDRFQAIQQLDLRIPMIDFSSDPGEFGKVSGGNDVQNLYSSGSNSLADENQTAVILYTSGTTGQPKGVELTHSNLYANAKSVSEEKFSTADKVHRLGPGHVGLAALPLSHAFGQTNLQNGLWLGGAAIVYQSRFDAREALELMRMERVTFFAGVPTMILAMVKEARQVHSGSGDLDSLALKFCVCGGAALDHDLKREFQRLFGVGIQESYGLSETSPMVSCQKIDSTEKSGSVGKPIHGVEVRIVDEEGEKVALGNRGEIVVRGHNVFKGYFRNPESTRQAFFGDWFRTGDVGIIDADGDLKIVDRIKDVILRGGYTIYPREIEAVLLEIEWVEEAVVIGVPDPQLGEQVMALITVSAGEAQEGADQGADQGVEYLATVHQDRSAMVAEIKAICKTKLAAFKCPTRVQVLKHMPRGSTGKIDRKALKKKWRIAEDSSQVDCPNS